MLTKKVVIAVIKEYSEQLVKSLKLEGLYIDIHVLSTRTNPGKKFHDRDPCVAFCDRHPYVNNGFTIVIFYDKQTDAKYTLGTLLHELLHVKFFDLVELVSNKKFEIAREIEEKIVQDLEKMIGALLT